MSDERVKPISPAHALAIGRYYVDHDPLRELESLRASLSWSAANGYHIPLSEARRKRLDEVIRFNRGEN